MEVEERPTITERYSSAVESSNLRPTADRRGDADYLIAAGWLDDSLGVLMLRLRVEFDAVRHDLRLRKGAAPIDRFLILQKLKTLDGAKAALARFSVQQATKRKFMQPDDVVLKLAGRVLDVHLDPLCHHCDGRGSNGGAHRGEKKEICRPCKGTGHRKDSVGRDADERRFAAFLLAELDRVCHAAGVAMARSLRFDAG
jgi:hypothetical protein